MKNPNAQFKLAEQTPCYFTPVLLLLLVIGMAIIPHVSFSQVQEDTIPVSKLKNLSLEELMNIEVTSVSRRPEKLSQTASAIQVITQEDIRRFGATNLAEALRIAGNLAVAQTGANQWAINARGFNAALANKLLVLIDGRAIYNPLFAGVWWDIQDVLLEDVDRIEVISGPGGTLWGANAVNGVINIITKETNETKGGLVVGGLGNELQSYAGVRYGAEIASNFHLRVYGKYSNRDGTVLSGGEEVDNDWRMGQGGFRMDGQLSETNFLTLQGDLYESVQQRPGFKDQVTSGGNVLARWKHTISENSDFKLQMYVDRVDRNSPGSFEDLTDTYDLDFQHGFFIGERNKVIWGGGYRLANDNFKFESSSVIFQPPLFSIQTYSAFVQDELSLKKDQVTLILGTRILHNTYTGFEVQPNIRASWKLNSGQFLWGAISRAVRMPSRVDHDLYAPGVLEGGPDFDSETLLAYELGYRIKPYERLSFSMSVFYHDYDNIRSLEPLNPPASRPLVIENGQAGESYGAELSSYYHVNDWLRVRAGYTIMQVNVWPKDGSRDTTFGASEAADSQHNFSLRSTINLPGRIEFSPSFRYVSQIKNPTQLVPGYFEVDLCLSFQATKNLEFSVIGWNLLDNQHPEFGRPATRQEIQRSIFGKVLWRF